MLPPGKKLSSKSEQDILACMLAGDLGTPRGKKKDWGQTVRGGRTWWGPVWVSGMANNMQYLHVTVAYFYIHNYIYCSCIIIIYIYMNPNNRNSQLWSHLGVLPLHCLLLRQTLFTISTRWYPLLHSYIAMLFKVVVPLSRIMFPLVMDSREPQLTTANVRVEACTV